MPELKYCCAKSIFTSKGMTSKNKPYPTCYPLLGSLDAVKSQPTDKASHVMVTVHLSCPWLDYLIVSLTVVLLFILL